jgi:hypothetical protein
MLVARPDFKACLSKEVISMWKLIGLIVLLGSRPDGKEATDRLVPPGYVGNPWGPVATKQRAAGALPPIALTPEMKRWHSWSKATLRDGDILFRRGDARVLGGYFPFSKFTANVSGSPFSHTAIVAIENGEPVVYDTTNPSVRRQPVYIWVLDNVGPIGLKRLTSAYAEHIPAVLKYCREQFQKQVPFDYPLGTDDTELYCVEMTEKAFRAAGLKLSDPVRLAEMENVDQFPISVFCFSTFSKLKLDQEVYFPGNDRHGIWSSPLLETVVAPPALVAGGKGQVPGDEIQKPVGPRE